MSKRIQEKFLCFQLITLSIYSSGIYGYYSLFISKCISWEEICLRRKIRLSFFPSVMLLIFIFGCGMFSGIGRRGKCQKRSKFTDLYLTCEDNWERKKPPMQMFTFKYYEVHFLSFTLHFSSSFFLADD